MVEMLNSGAMQLRIKGKMLAAHNRKLDYEAQHEEETKHRL